MVILNKPIPNSKLQYSIFSEHCFRHDLVNALVNFLSHVLHQEDPAISNDLLQLSEVLLRFSAFSHYFQSHEALLELLVFEHFLEPGVSLELRIDEHGPLLTAHGVNSIVDADTVAWQAIDSPVSYVHGIAKSSYQRIII